MEGLRVVGVVLAMCAVMVNCQKFGVEEDWDCLRGLRSWMVDENNLLGNWSSGRGEAWRICEWRGVRCDRFYVTELDLGGAGLKGVLGEFSSLRGCSNLGVLKLGWNRLSGAIPASICDRFPNITFLDLSHNNFSHSIPSFGSCQRLGYLNLESNILEGSIPEELGLLPDLAQLNLSSNRLSGPIPDTLLLTSTPSPAPRFLGTSFTRNANLSFPSDYCSMITVTVPECTAASAAGFSSSSLNSKLVGALIAISVFTGLILLSVLLKLAVWKVTSSVQDLSSSRRAFASRTMRDEPVRIMSKKLKKLKPLKVHHLLTATSNFSDACVVGSGGCSTVYRACLADGTTVAIKLLHLSRSHHSLQQEGLSQKTLDHTFKRELETFLKVRHRNLVKILGCVAKLKMKLLVLEYMPLGSLEQQLYGPFSSSSSSSSSSWDVEAPLFQCSLDWERRYRIAVGVALGLTYLHHDLGTPLIHGDLKPSNILLDDDFEPHISDFGMAKLVSPSLADSIFGSDAHLGTVGYSAPEKAYSLKTSTKEDVYSFGILLLELLTRQRPTSSLFGEGVTISEWVERALPCQSVLLQYVVDPMLVQSPDFSKEQVAGISLMLRVGVLCTLQQPASRPDMRTVTKLLQQIKEAAECTKFASIDTILQEEVGLTPFLPTHVNVGTITFSED